MNINGMNLAIEQITGSKNVLISDDLGIPSMMVRIPKFNLSDVIPGGPDTPHPMFIVNGKVKDCIYIGKYLACVDNDRAYSLPGREPMSFVTYDDARKMCYNKGPGWHMMTNMERVGIGMMCRANGTYPIGNTDNGVAFGNRHYAGVPVASKGSVYRKGHVTSFSGHQKHFYDVGNAGSLKITSQIGPGLEKEPNVKGFNQRYEFLIKEDKLKDISGLEIITPEHRNCIKTPRAVEVEQGYDKADVLYGPSVLDMGDGNYRVYATHYDGHKYLWSYMMTRNFRDFTRPIPVVDIPHNPVYNNTTMAFVADVIRIDGEITFFYANGNSVRGYSKKEGFFDVFSDTVYDEITSVSMEYQNGRYHMRYVARKGVDYRILYRVSMGLKEWTVPYDLGINGGFDLGFTDYKIDYINTINHDHEKLIVLGILSDNVRYLIANVSKETNPLNKFGWYHLLQPEEDAKNVRYAPSGIDVVNGIAVLGYQAGSTTTRSLTTISFGKYNYFTADQKSDLDIVPHCCLTVGDTNYVFAKNGAEISYYTTTDGGQTFGQKMVCTVPNSGQIKDFSVLKNDIGEYHMMVLTGTKVITGKTTNLLNWNLDNVVTDSTRAASVASLYTPDKKYLKAYVAGDDGHISVSLGNSMGETTVKTIVEANMLMKDEKPTYVDLVYDGEKILLFFGAKVGDKTHVYACASYDNGATWPMPRIFKYTTRRKEFKDYPSDTWSIDNFVAGMSKDLKSLYVLYRNKNAGVFIDTYRSLNRCQYVDIVMPPHIIGSKLNSIILADIHRENGIYKMWGSLYEDDTPPSKSRIVYLTSRDGVYWSKPVRCVLPIDNAPYDFNKGSFASLIKEEDGTYKCWFEGIRTIGGTETSFLVMAKSTDGITFTDIQKTSLFSLNSHYNSICKTPDGKYRIWFTTGNDDKIFTAISDNGLDFSDIKEVFNFTDSNSPYKTPIYDIKAVYHDGKYVLTFNSALNTSGDSVDKGQRTIISYSDDGVTFTDIRSISVGSVDPFSINHRSARLIFNQDGSAELFMTSTLISRYKSVTNDHIVFHTTVSNAALVGSNTIVPGIDNENLWDRKGIGEAKVQHQLVKDGENLYCYYIDAKNNLVRTTPIIDTLSPSYFKNLTEVVTCRLPLANKDPRLPLRVHSFHIFIVGKIYHLIACVYPDGAVDKTKIYRFTSSDGVIFDDSYERIGKFNEKDFVSVNGCELHDSNGKVNGYRIYVHQSDPGKQVTFIDSTDCVTWSERKSTLWTFSQQECTTYPSSPDYVQIDGVVHEFTPRNNTTTGASIALHTSLNGAQFARAQSVGDEIFRARSVVFNGYSAVDMGNGKYASIFSTGTTPHAVITEGISTEQRARFQYKNKEKDLVLYPSRMAYDNCPSMYNKRVTMPKNDGVYYMCVSKDVGAKFSFQDDNVYILTSTDCVHWELLTIAFNIGDIGVNMVAYPVLVFISGTWYIYYTYGTVPNHDAYRISLGSDLKNIQRGTPEKLNLSQPIGNGRCLPFPIVGENKVDIYYQIFETDSKNSLHYETSTDGLNFSGHRDIFRADWGRHGVLGQSADVDGARFFISPDRDGKVIIAAAQSAFATWFKVAIANIGAPVRSSDFIDIPNASYGNMDLTGSSTILPYKDGYAFIRTEGYNPEDKSATNDFSSSLMVSFTKNLRTFYADYDEDAVLDTIKATAEGNIDFNSPNAWNTEISLSPQTTIPLYQVGKQIVFNKMQRSQFFRVLNAKRLIVEAKYVDDKNKPFTVLGQVSITKKTTNWQIDVNETSGIVVRNENGEVLLSVNNTGYSTNVDLNDVDRITNDRSFINEGETSDVQVRILIKEVYNAEGAVKTLTGTCGTSHDGTVDGIMDLCGNVWEYAAGLKLKTNRILVAKNNNAASWWFGDEKLVAIYAKDFNSYAGQDDDKTAALVKSTDGKPKLAIRSNQTTMEYFDKTPVKQIDLSDTANRVVFNAASVIGLNLGMYTDGNIEETIATVNNIDTEKFSDKRIATFGGDMSSKITKGGILSTFFAHEESMCQYGVGFRVCYYDPD